MNQLAARGIKALLNWGIIMEKLDKDLQNWLWFFTSAAVVVTAGLAKIKLVELVERR